MLFHLHKPNFRELDAAVFNGYITVYTVCRVTSAAAFFGLEFWKTCFRVPEKVLIRPLQVHLCVSQGKTVNFLQPLVFFFVLCRSVI